MKLYKHQEDGVAWLLGLERGMLADEQGLGKTITAIRAFDLLDAPRVLVIVPTVVLFNWEAEVGLWAPGRTVQVLATGKDDLRPDVDVVVVTHGLLLRPWIREQLKRGLPRPEGSPVWSVAVLDEAHGFKSHEAKRSLAFYNELAPRCDRVWLMTGTPCPNNVGELWTHLRGLEPWRIELDGQVMSEPRFVDRFCITRETQYGRKITGNRKDRLPELKKRLDGFILRRLKSKVLKDLPPIRFETVHLRPLKLGKALEVIEAAVSSRVAAELEGAGDAGEVFERLKDAEDFTRFRRLCGLAKAEPVGDLVWQELEEGGLEKVVVFAWHKDVIELLAKKLERFGVRTITGATPALERRASVEAFQTSPRVRVIVANIVAGGVGITLTAAADVVFAEQSWTPGDNAQASDRCHRIGQTERVRVRFASLAGTIDEAVTASLRTKSAMIREVLGE